MAGHVIVSREESITITQLNKRSIKPTLNNFLSLYPQVNASSSLIGETSVCNRWWLTQRPTAGQAAESKRLHNFSPKWSI